MKRVVVFCFLIVGVVFVSVVLIQEQFQDILPGSLSAFFQETGKPFKSVDRTVSMLSFVSEEDEAKLGEEFKKGFEQSLTKSEEHHETREYLTKLIDRLTRDSKKPFSYKVFLFEDKYMNAFAAPGGVICIGRELLELFSDEAELVSVLAHEIGHVERGHTFDMARGELASRKMMGRGAQFIILELLGRFSRPAFSKTQENEADEFAFRMLISEGYDPLAQSRAFEKLISFEDEGVKSPIEEFFLTHPQLELRAEKFRTRANKWLQCHKEQKVYQGKRNFQERKTQYEISYSDEFSLRNNATL